MNGVVLVFLCTTKPNSSVELSFHVSWVRDDDADTAVKALGSDGAAASALRAMDWRPNTLVQATALRIGFFTFFTNPPGEKDADQNSNSKSFGAVALGTRND